MDAPNAMPERQNDPLTHRLLLAALLAFVFVCGFFQVSDVDVGYHMRTGAHVLEHRAIPAVNTFSFTRPEHPWVLQQWWPTVFYYLVYTASGVSALITFKALLGVLLMYLLWRGARQESARGSLWPFWLVTIGVLIVRVRFFERPFFFSAILFTLLLLLERRHGNSRRWQWLGLPALMAFWSNTHAGVMYGFVYLTTVAGAEWLEWGWKTWRQQRRDPMAKPVFNRDTLRPLLVRPAGLLLAVAASFVALQLINPNGYRVLLVPIDMFTNRFWQTQIQEFFPPTWERETLFFVSLGAVAALQVITRRDFNLRYFLVSLVFGYLACKSQRSIMEFVLVAVPHTARMLRHLPACRLAAVPRVQHGLLPVSWLALSLLVVVPDKTFRFGTGFYAPYYPLEIFELMKAEVPSQHVFNDMLYGGEMMWWLYPKFKPFVDGRGDAWPVDFWENEYVPVINGDARWREVFRKYDIHGALLSIPLDHKVSRFAQSLRTQPDWALVAFNDYTLLFLERTEANREVIAQNEFRLLWPGDWAFSAFAGTNLPAATGEARRALARSPESVFAQTALARASLMGGDYASAAELYAVLTRQPGASGNYWRDYGYALFMLKRYDEADRVFTRMIRDGKAAGFACYMKHFLALQHNDVPAADQWLTQALELEPGNADYLRAQASLRAAQHRKP